MKALITGSSSGIGKDMALYLAEMGYDLILVARDEKGLIKVKERVIKDINNNINVKVILKDLTKYEEIISLYNQLKEENIDMLINNAGFGIFGNFNETNLDRDLEMIDLNIKSVHVLTKLFLKDMINRNSGYILNTSSLASFMPGPLMSEYYATKAYVTRLTQGIDKELKKMKKNVYIGILCPGPVDTNFNNVAGVKFSMKALSSEYVAKYAIDKMLKRKVVIIPGFINKCARFFSKITSDKILAEVGYNIQKRKEIGK